MTGPEKVLAAGSPSGGDAKSSAVQSVFLVYWVNYKGASTLSTQLMKRDGETCCRLAFSTRLPCTLDMPNKASDMSRARCCHGGVELPVLWHACPSGDQTIYQARIPHTSFSSGDMIRWQVRVRLGQRVYLCFGMSIYSWQGHCFQEHCWVDFSWPCPSALPHLPAGQINRRS